MLTFYVPDKGALTVATDNGLDRKIILGYGKYIIVTLDTVFPLLVRPTASPKLGSDT